MVSETGELIRPNAFLPMAERLELAQAIDRWVVSAATRLAAHERATDGEVCLSINISPKSLADPSFPEHIEAEITAAGIDPSALTFEFSEAAAIFDVDATSVFSARLRALHRLVALDDFGAGLAALHYLHDVDFDYIKIDGELVGTVATSPPGRLVVGAIATVAKGLGKKTIATCVPDGDTAAMLQRLDVDYVQGYGVARPRPVGVMAGTHAPSDRDSPRADGS
jgi:EAL domain-containing protein (putative c-di-GMP-specific phosphodiesterase class I)